MRIISGKLKGREVKGYAIDGTRPTMDRVKESIFSIIQENVRDAIVLDLFAGSGNLGLEAISNGCKKAYFIDKNKIATKTIQENGTKFQVLDQMEILSMDEKNALFLLEERNVKFDLVFLDPPYHDNVILSVLDSLREKKLLNPGALIICEMEENYIGSIRIEGYLLIKQKSYGSKYVNIYEYQ